MTYSLSNVAPGTTFAVPGTQLRGRLLNCPLDALVELLPKGGRAWWSSSTQVVLADPPVAEPEPECTERITDTKEARRNRRVLAVALLGPQPDGAKLRPSCGDRLCADPSHWSWFSVHRTGEPGTGEPDPGPAPEDPVPGPERPVGGRRKPRQGIRSPGPADHAGHAPDDTPTEKCPPFEGDPKVGRALRRKLAELTLGPRGDRRISVTCATPSCMNPAHWRLS